MLATYDYAAGGSLIIRASADQVELAVDIAPELEGSESVRPAMRKQLQAAGLKITDKADVVFVASCKALPAQRVYIRQDPNRRFVPQWVTADEYDRTSEVFRGDLQQRSMVLYDSKIAMLHNGRELFSWGGITRPLSNIYAEEGESLDQALKRLTTPNLKRFMSFPFVAEAALLGDATDNGAYCFSTINESGVLEDL